MSRYHQQVARLATGEMSHVDPEEWPVHRDVANALGGELMPFDMYQGPYVAWEGRRIFIGPPEVIWKALVLGEGWVYGLDDEGEAVQQVQEALSRHGVEQDASDFVRPDDTEGYVVATDTVSGESTLAYPNVPDAASILVEAIRKFTSSSSTSGQASPPATP